ncbi:MAG: hypothetical protein U0804_12635 [Gemmataceae bacterium]
MGNPRYFYLSGPSHPWGDYYRVLADGYGAIIDGVCRVQRTGPFIPPVTFPHAMVVTDALRADLEASALTGVTFVPVVKQKVVASDWHEWNLKAPNPREYPEEAEPSNYIDRGEHSPAAAEALGTLWAVDVLRVARVTRSEPVDHTHRHLHLNVESAQGLDFVRSPDVGFLFVSERAKAWLEARVGRWVAFEEANTAPPGPPSGAGADRPRVGWLVVGGALVVLGVIAWVWRLR